MFCYVFMVVKYNDIVDRYCYHKLYQWITYLSMMHLYVYQNCRLNTSCCVDVLFIPCSYKVLKSCVVFYVHVVCVYSKTVDALQQVNIKKRRKKGTPW